MFLRNVLVSCTLMSSVAFATSPPQAWIDSVDTLIDNSHTYLNNMKGIEEFIQDIIDDPNVTHSKTLDQALESAKNAVTSATSYKSDLEDAFTEAGETPPSYTSNPTTYTSQTEAAGAMLTDWLDLTETDYETVWDRWQEVEGTWTNATAIQQDMENAFQDAAHLGGQISSIAAAMLVGNADVDDTTFEGDLEQMHTQMVADMDLFESYARNTPCTTTDLWCINFNEGHSAFGSALNDVIAALNDLGITTPKYSYTTTTAESTSETLGKAMLASHPMILDTMNYLVEAADALHPNSAAAHDLGNAYLNMETASSRFTSAWYIYNKLPPRP